MTRIHVIGTSGSGKTTLAAHLAQHFGIPHIELDALHWGPHWEAVPLETFRQRVEAALQGPAWTVDGNYGKVRALIWSRADTVVWLDYSRAVIMSRLLLRTLHRAISGKELWHGNRESLRKAFFSRDSILLWAWQTYPRRRREYPVLLAQPEYAQLQVIRLRSPKESRAWLTSLEK